MFVLPLPLENTLVNLEQSKGGLAQPQLYVVVNGIPTKKKVIWRSLIDINKVKAASSHPAILSMSERKHKKLENTFKWSDRYILLTKGYKKNITPKKSVTFGELHCMQ